MENEDLEQLDLPADADAPAAAGAEPAAGPSLDAPTEGDEGPPEDAPPSEVDELRDRHLRLAAEFDNFRKRTARERADLHARAQGDLLRGLLDTLDDLARVAHPDHGQAAVRDVLEGVELVERNLLRQLAAAGLEQIGAVDDPFDPNLHEAVTAGSAETAEQDQTIGAVLQVGYRFHGHLLRPARVQVRMWSGESGGGGGE